MGVGGRGDWVSRSPTSLHLLMRTSAHQSATPLGCDSSPLGDVVSFLFWRQGKGDADQRGDLSAAHGQQGQCRDPGLAAQARGPDAISGRRPTQCLACCSVPGHNCQKTHRPVGPPGSGKMVFSQPIKLSQARNVPLSPSSRLDPQRSSRGVARRTVNLRTAPRSAEEARDTQDSTVGAELWLLPHPS